MQLATPEENQAAFIRFQGQRLAIPPHLTFEDWQASLAEWRRYKKLWHNGFADLLKFGIERFGEERVEATLANLEFELNDVKLAMAIESLPDHVRKENLSVKHYRVCQKAGLDLDSTCYWLETASANNLTPKSLQHSIATGKLTHGEPSRAWPGMFHPAGLRFYFDRWLALANKTGGPDTWSKEQVRDLLDNIKPIAELYSLLNK